MDQYMGKTLLLPLVAMGSVPQYAVQTLIDNKKQEFRKEIIQSPYVYPFSGCNMSILEIANGVKNEKKDEIDLISPWELYSHANINNNQIEIMQMHSPIIPGCESLYIKQLAQIIKERGYRSLIILDAQDKGLCHDDNNDINDNFKDNYNEIQYWCNKTVSKLKMEDNKFSLNEENSTTANFGNFLKFLVQEIENLGEDISIQYYSISVYEGWNGPAAKKLLEAVGFKGGKEANIIEMGENVGKQLVGVINAGNENCEGIFN